jgi:hypothetical protein
MDNSGWIRLDDVLCGLVDRLQVSGYNHVLEVEFRPTHLGLGEEDRHRVLPQFREKGLVKIVAEGSRRVRR